MRPHILPRLLRAPDRGSRLSLGTRIELIQSLFAIPAPAVIMTICFAGAGYYVVRNTDDMPLLVLFVLSIFSSAGRLGTLFGYRRTVFSDAIEPSRVFTIERCFAASYIAFAIFFGLFTARAFLLVNDHMRLPIVALVYGYGAGVAATVALRPWISVTSIAAAIVPLIGVGIAMGSGAYLGTAALTVMFLGGGIIAMMQRYRSASNEIQMRRLLETLNRQDDLTELPNRLQLDEHFASLAARRDSGALIAIHRVDIDGFANINLEHGQLIGDAVLKAVSRRLGRIGRGCLSARLGGDDFLIVQSEIGQAREADILAHKIVQTLEKSYGIAGRDVHVAARVGYIVDIQRDADLDDLVAHAETTLARAKQEAVPIAGETIGAWNAAA
ncbi:GGDEF domain-containing protein [Sphingomonas montanisoli]|uniref:GGDEF domain-containing protein n=1 Tax=Sphingomonas montanisoli TaxID=2606412 RepID=UPI0011F1022D|nr:GGDEF domain-containing protein [Sphingomonas montanisoli]